MLEIIETSEEAREALRYLKSVPSEVLSNYDIYLIGAYAEELQKPKATVDLLIRLKEGKEEKGHVFEATKTCYSVLNSRYHTDFKVWWYTAIEQSFLDLKREQQEEGLEYFKRNPLSNILASAQKIEEDVPSPAEHPEKEIQVLPKDVTTALTAEQMQEQFRRGGC